MSVYERLQELHHIGGKTDSKTPFEIVGEEFGIEPKFAAQMYYVVAKNIVQHWEELWEVMVKTSKPQEYCHRLDGIMKKAKIVDSFLWLLTFAPKMA